MQILHAAPAVPNRPSTAIFHLGASRNTFIPLGIHRHIRRGDLLILHEGWVISNIFAALTALAKRVPYIIVPHGVYEPPVVASQRDQLRLRAAAERFLLRHATGIHIFYASETDSVHKLEPKAANFVVAANGSPRPEETERWRGGGDYFVWLGRFDVDHKGLDRMLLAWSALPDPRPNLIMAGPDFMGGRNRVLEMVSSFGLQQNVTVLGNADERQKWELLCNSRGYIHPSRWESCSMLLLEALAAGVPSLISASIHAARDTELCKVVKTYDFGSDHKNFATTLSELDGNTRLSDSARAWAKQMGSWTKVGANLASHLRNATTT